MNAIPLPLWDQLPATLPWKEKISWIGLKLSEGESSSCPVTHEFGHGLYIRRMHIPARTLFIGRSHIVGHECTLLSGSVIWIWDGGRKQMDAVKTVHTTPGFNMVVYALTDIEAQTVHSNPTNSEDIIALEDGIFEPSHVMRGLGERVNDSLRLS